MPRRRGIDRFFRRFFRGTPDESFRALVQANAFNQIQYLLESGPSYSKNKLRWLYKDMYEQGPLHFILPYRPPLSVVASILQCTGDFSHVPEEALDSKGRTPLHIAAAFNCSYQIIRRLLSGVSLVVPALTRDDMDRLPLHWACCHPFMTGRAELENKFDTIILLLDAYPQAVDMADASGNTPLEYALKHRGIDDRITDLLQKVSARQREQTISFQKMKGRGRSRKPRRVVDPNEQSFSSSAGGGVPSEINAQESAVAARRGSRYNTGRSGSHGGSGEDDISSLGWDRVSMVTPPTTSPNRMSSATRSISPTTSTPPPPPVTNKVSKTPLRPKKAAAIASKEHRSSFPLRAKSFLKGYLRRFLSPQQKQITVAKSDPRKIT